MPWRQARHPQRRALPRPQHGRAGQQQDDGLAGHRHPLRQEARELPRRTPSPRSDHLDQQHVRKIAAPPLNSADGIARRGNTLYVARSVNDEIATLRLSADHTRATLDSRRTYPGADTTTGVAISGDRLLVSNSQMDTYLYGYPLTSTVFTLESLPLHH